MADFKFLRTEAPDVMRYLPAFLAEDEHFLAIQNGLSREHGVQKELLADIARQFFVETATWGLNTWERIYKTEPPLDADYDLRRTLLKTKMLGRQVMTKKNTELIINQYTNNGKGYVVEDAGPGAISVVLPCRVEHPELLAKALNEMLPAHLGYSFRLVINDVDDDGNVDINGGIHQYNGIVRSIGGRKQIHYGFDDFEAESLFTAKGGIASIRHGNKVIGGGTDIEMNGRAFAYNLNSASGSRTIDVVWPDDLPKPKHEFHFEGNSGLSGGVARLNRGYIVIDTEIPDDLPRPKHEFHFEGDGSLAGSVIHAVSGIRTIFAEAEEIEHLPVDIHMEDANDLAGMVVHVHTGIRVIDTEPVKLPIDRSYHGEDKADLLGTVLDVRTGSRFNGLEPELEDVHSALNTGTLNITTGTKTLLAGFIDSDDTQAEPRTGVVELRTGDREIHFAVGLPDDVQPEARTGIYTTTTGIKTGGIENPADMEGKAAYTALHTVGGYKTIVVDIDRSERYIKGGTVPCTIYVGSRATQPYKTYNIKCEEDNK